MKQSIKFVLYYLLVIATQLAVFPVKVFAVDALSVTTLRINAPPPEFPGTLLYVNTDAADENGDGTSGAPWKYLRTAITANALDTALAAGPVRIVYTGVTDDTRTVTQTHWNSVTTTAAHYLQIVGNDTSPLTWSNSATTIVGQDENIIYNNAPGQVWIYFLQVKNTCTTSNNSQPVGLRLATQNVGGPGDTDNDCGYFGCSVWLVSTGTDHPVGFYDSDYEGGSSPGAGTIKRINCVAFGQGTGFGSANTGVENDCCLADCDYQGFEGNQIIKNSASLRGSANAFNSVGTGGGASDWNASNDATAPGVNSKTNQNFGSTFVSRSVPPGDTTDYHLQGSDTVLRNAGSTTQTVDGENTARPQDGQDDIGPDEDD